VVIAKKQTGKTKLNLFVKNLERPLPALCSLGRCQKSPCFGQVMQTLVLLFLYSVL